eukprot:332424-Alexandrium_andersonii.AAC.1
MPTRTAAAARTAAGQRAGHREGHSPSARSRPARQVAAPERQTGAPNEEGVRRPPGCRGGAGHSPRRGASAQACP